ncbi:MAG: tRNA (adenosine(37)-N6)-threonylcarbamoyltransferase complex dimerization subunit type 1 TsaB [Gemmatimonadota bacterium]
MLLAIDTAAPVANLALGLGERLVAERSAAVDTSRSEALLPTLDAMFTSAGVTPGLLTGVVVGGGPGSYTGIRIAAAAAKGLTQALGLPLYAHGSLEAMSAGADIGGRPVCSVIPARRGEVFMACHLRRADGLSIVHADALIGVAEVAGLAGAYDAVVVGPVAAAYAAALRDAGVEVDQALGEHRARGLLDLHRWRGDAGLVADPLGWEPVYLRPAVDGEHAS